ncbi:MAG: GIY-YIG nuclease family protein [Tannerellaceae bacterium]|nr:GIY-YIG nuclease family protein [Tannerellaceae bacterium]
MFYVYILFSAKLDSYYVGSTGNIEDRIKRHNQGRSKATKKGIPWRIVYKKAFETRSQAYRAELYIKSQKSKSFIQNLIKQQQPTG